MGRRYVKVLPLPVEACKTADSPLYKGATATDWIGVGVCKKEALWRADAAAADRVSSPAKEASDGLSLIHI
eukprot:4086274-Ditylum_brightwellii.AAC.1